MTGTCSKGANAFAEKYFHDCIYDVRDYVGFGLGLCSILVWLTAQLPQFYSNIKNQSSEALSIWFLVEWFAGDTLNLLGCLVQGQQLPTTTILAAYFVLMDVIMLLQYIYYGALQARRKRLRAKAHRKRHAGHHSHHGSHHSRDGAWRGASQDAPRAPSAVRVHCGDLQQSDDSSFSFTPGATMPTAAPEQSSAVGATAAGPAVAAGSWRVTAAAATAGMSLVCVAALALQPAAPPPPGSGGSEWLHTGPHPGTLLSRRHLLFNPSDTIPADALTAADPAMWAGGDLGKKHGGGGDGCSFLNCDVALVAGTVMGYLSTCFYLASRVSQIRKNLARKSTEGLSHFMFLLTITANLCTGVSIVLRLRTVEQLKDQLPWMCGTFGTIALDATLFYQTITLGAHGHGHGHGQGQGHSSSHGGHGHSHAHHHHHHGHHHERPADGAAVLANGCGGCGGGVARSAGEGGGGKLASDLEAPLLGSYRATEDS